MNEALVKNWNESIKPSDTVYFLGDLCYGRNSRNPQDWLDKLQGKLVFIRGSHDYKLPLDFGKAHDIIEVGALQFYLVHNPQDVPRNWEEYTIHGHNHRNYPLIHGKSVNVSVEVIDYKPISLFQVISILKDSATCLLQQKNY